MPESDAGRRSRSSCSLLPFSLGALRSRGRGGGNFGGAYFSLAGARKVNRATRLYPGPRIRTPGGQGLMSASSAFGSQSSRSPQARAPILALSLSSFLPSARVLQPFLSLTFLSTESESDRNTFLLFAFVPLYFARPPSTHDFLPSRPFLFPGIHAFYLLPPLKRAASARFFFFFKIRDDEISFFLFFAS